MKKQSTIFTFFILLLFTANGQFNYNVANSSLSLSNYTDIGSNGTAITTNFQGGVMTYRNANSSIQNIGFNFIYNGKVFTQFVLSANGFIKLGRVAPAIGNSNPFNSDTNIICPVTFSMIQNAAPEYRVYTNGVAGSRVCTIQFKGIRDSSTFQQNQFFSLEFQIKLYETSNDIEFVYGNFLPTTLKSSTSVYNVGIKGSDLISFVNYKGNSTADWSASKFLDSIFNISSGKYLSNNNYPINGLTIKFKAFTAPNKDAKVYTVYHTPKIVINNPHIVSACIKNTGNTTLNNLPITLTVNGANTFTDVQTIASLPAGANTVVYFKAYTPLIAGVNTIKVYVPTDDVNSNNQMNKTETVGAVFSNVNDASVFYSGVKTSLGSDNGILIENTGSKAINQITAYSTSASGEKFLASIYSAFNNTPETLIWASDTLICTSKQTLVSVPNIAVTDNFFIVFTQPATSSYFTGFEFEFPLRNNVFFERSPNSTGTWRLQKGGASNNNYNKYLTDVQFADVLPLTLLDFNTQLKGNNCFISCKLGSAETISSIVLERSMAGSNDWKTIDSRAIIQQNSLLTYAYTDENIPQGKYFYRLKLIEKTGAFSYSSTKVVDVTNNPLFVLYQNYPNPAVTSTTIGYELDNAANVSIELFNQEGKLVTTWKRGTQSKGKFAFQVNVSSLPSGTYHYKLVATNEKNGSTISLIKQMQIAK